MGTDKQITLEQQIMKKILAYAHWRCVTINKIVNENDEADGFMKEDFLKLRTLTNEIMTLCAYRRLDILFKLARELEDTERRQNNDDR